MGGAAPNTQHLCRETPGGGPAFLSETEKTIKSEPRLSEKHANACNLDSKNSEENKNICTILEEKIALAQRIEDAKFMTKRLFKTFIMEKMNGWRKFLEEKAERYEKDMEDITEQCRKEGGTI